ncbi:MAG TPA: hypothetical protein VLM85_00335 [Polyangiaceae bacterium]|nr:hypothetical protein [Polyangiaceae bacterium]
MRASRSWLLLLGLLAACGRRHESSSATASATSPPPGTSILAQDATNPVVREKFDAAELSVPPGKSTLHVAWALPEGTGINDDAPFSVRWGSSDGLSTPPGDIRGLGKQVAGGFDIPIEIMPGSTGALLAGDIDLVVCDVATHSICLPLKRRLELTFAVTKGSAAGKVTLPLPQAKP